MPQWRLATSADVVEVAALAADRGRFGIDTEFMSEGRYRALLCLTQIAVEDPSDGGTQRTLLIDGLANAYKLYSPKMIAVSTTCMAEVIGDDLQAFISTAKQKGSVPEDFALCWRRI